MQNQVDNAAPARLDWIDGLRGAAVLGSIALAARAILQPQANVYDPTVAGPLTPAAWAWWALVETFADETAVWLLAAVFGMALAAARETAEDGEWPAQYRARLCTLGAAGLAFALSTWPGDLLGLLALSGLLVGGAVGDRECRPLWIGVGAGCVGAIGGLGWIDGQGPLLLGPRLPHEAVSLGSAEYNTWETALYGGSLADGVRIRWAQLLDRLRTVHAYRTLWQVGGATLLGVWWYRAGRHRQWARGTAPLAGIVGSVYTGGAVYMGTISGFDDRTLTTWQTATYVGGAFLASGAVLAATNARDAAWKRAAGRWLRQCGRNSLTLYVASVATLCWIAHGWGRGLHGLLDPEQTVAATVMVLALTAGLGEVLKSRPMPVGAEQAWRLAVRICTGRRPRRAARRGTGTS